MRLRHADGTTVHLAYCTNVHPAESISGILAQLETYAVPVRRRLGVDLVGLGLWLPAATAAELAGRPAAVARLRRRLTALGLETVTLNGFPYRGFHDEVVKQAVYHPDWTTPERLEYTLNLATVLAGLLPDDVTEGSISTLPFAWREPWPDQARDSARRQLDALARGLARVARDTGRRIRVGLEAEPGCVAETVPQILAGLAGTDPEFLGLCLDTCHLAVAHEDPAEALAAISEAGIPVVKTQASAALTASEPGSAATRDVLRPFAEPRFLHQVREPAPGGGAAPLGRDDLAPALDPERGLPGDAPWRVHFHVPLHLRPEPPLGSTRPVLSSTLHELFGGERARTSHVEVETYTWSVLPAAQRPDGAAQLAAGIAAELAWCRDELMRNGLRPC